MQWREERMGGNIQYEASLTCGEVDHGILRVSDFPATNCLMQDAVWMSAGLKGGQVKWVRIII